MSEAVLGATSLTDSLGPAVGGKTAKILLEGFGMRTVGDLLGHYPRRYLTPGEMSDLGALTPGEHVTIFAEVVSVRSTPMRQRKGQRVEVVVTDGTGYITLVFFGQKWRESQCQPGRRGLFEGTVSIFRSTKQLTHPRLLILPGSVADPDEVEAARFFTARMVPIYAATAKVPSWRIGNAISHVLESLGAVDDPVPADIQQDEGLIGVEQALTWIHRPTSMQEVEAARRRLQFDEAFVLQVVLAQRRAEWRSLTAIPRTAVAGGLLTEFEEASPFDLTSAQQRVGSEIFADLAANHPMHRLLQGDVGSGKTLVALRAMLAVVDAGGQAALIAPTEVLAQQHAATIRGLLGPLAEGGMLSGAVNATGVQLMTGSMSAKQRREGLLAIVSGEAGIVIGTHALFEESVQFAELGLVVIDEQHRFGVEQRAVLHRALPDGTRPHMLVMTATPIPRTVAMTVFGDLSVSVLDELPKGRQPIATHVISRIEQPRHVARAWQRVREEVEAGGKAYVVCARIGAEDVDEEDSLDALANTDSDDKIMAASVVATAHELSTSILSDLRVGVLHGRMTADDKEQIMRRFAAASSAADSLDVLVSTTVIEVGVDVPSATIMIVLDADRFGISQLHQLRGRVGRGAAASLCILVTSVDAQSPARARLDAVASTTDGFELARIDLQSRREGDVLGAAQSGGRTSLRLLEVVRDESVIQRARAAAESLVARDPDLSRNLALRELTASIQRDDRAEYLHKG